MSSSNTMSHDEAICQFCGVTGADEERARGLLEACEWNLELAINMHVDTDPEGRSTNRKAQQTASTSSNSEANMMGPAELQAATSHFNSNHRNNAVHIDADDDDDAAVSEDLTDTRGGRFASRHSRLNNAAIRSWNLMPAEPSASRTTDAATSATAYSNLLADSDGVRPPIAPVRQILNPNPIGYPAPDLLQARRYNTRAGPISDVYDAFRDFQAEAQWQEVVQEGEQATTASDSNRRLTLQELFRPPLELMFRGNFESARETGTTKNRWLLVNIHNGKEFACQILNRDVWSNQAVKDIIKEHFIFWQVYSDSYEGNRYVQFYNVTKLPHVAIIDPRTGELMKSWPTSIDHNSFCDSVIEFLTEHPSPDGSTDANTMKKLRVKEDDEEEQDDEPQVIATRATLYDQSEEAQLEAAIRASLQEKFDTNDDTIEIDEDTIEATDIPDPEQIARDKELIDRPTNAETKKKPNSNNSFQPAQPHDRNSSAESYKALASTNNNSAMIQKEPQQTAAEALKTIAAERTSKIQGAECRIALRFPDGSSLVHKFSASEQLKSVKEFVQMGHSSFGSSRIEFIAPPNRKLTESMMKDTLESLGLCPASRLEVKCVSE